MVSLSVLEAQRYLITSGHTIKLFHSAGEPVCFEMLREFATPARTKYLPLHRLELYFKDHRSLLIVFPNWKRRQDACDRLMASVASQRVSPFRSPLVFHRSPLLARAAPKFLQDVRDELATAQRKWQAREISNVSMSLS